MRLFLCITTTTLLTVLFPLKSALAETVTAIENENSMPLGWTIDTCDSLIRDDRIHNPPLSASAQYYYISPLRDRIGYQLHGGRLGSLTVKGPNCVETLKAALNECAHTEGVVGCRVHSYECKFDCQNTDFRESDVKSVYESQGCSPYPTVTADDAAFTLAGYKIVGEKIDHRRLQSWPGDSQLAIVNSINTSSKTLIQGGKSRCDMNKGQFRCYHDKMNDYLLYNRGWAGGTHFSTRCWSK